MEPNMVMLGIGIALCGINIKSFCDYKKHPDTDRLDKLRSIFSFMVGIFGILIGSGMFRQNMLLAKVIGWIGVVSQCIVIIITIITTKLRK